MTQLERELKLELKLQRELFAKELQSVTSTYEDSLRSIESGYRLILKEQAMTIDTQRKALDQYKSISSDLRVSLDQEQLQSLRELNERLDALESSDKNLVEQLNAVLAKL